MICYNVHVKLNDELNEEEWRSYMIDEHIPDVMKTGCFLECKMTKNIERPRNWHIQYFLENMDKMKEYQNNHATKLKQEVIDKYNGSFQATRTITDIVHTF